MWEALPANHHPPTHDSGDRGDSHPLPAPPSLETLAAIPPPCSFECKPAEDYHHHHHHHAHSNARQRVRRGTTPTPTTSLNQTQASRRLPPPPGLFERKAAALQRLPPPPHSFDCRMVENYHHHHHPFLPTPSLLKRKHHLL